MLKRSSCVHSGWFRASFGLYSDSGWWSRASFGLYSHSGWWSRASFGLYSPFTVTVGGGPELVLAFTVTSVWWSRASFGLYSHSGWWSRASFALYTVGVGPELIRPCILQRSLARRKISLILKAL
ncbi:hypothetical protein PoB_003440400 [Plakobranchus ocellatus]|uniref:Uncharacterized protein n=1 Tax=Plakobranchus ocellatus TaxID=259542 RepID=A0AAV4ANJ7_9GAST|nr:hypothetical protein PoB_003440400 [Plakobranchus ocellatus]